jgi:CheY-like chemotaxis protein
MPPQPSVLVVGSSPRNSEVIATCRGNGHTVENAAHAFQALAIVARKSIALVLCAPDLPGRSSDWLAEQVHRHRPDLPVVVLPDRGSLPAIARPARREPEAAVSVNAPDRRRERRNAHDHTVYIRPGHDATVVDASSSGLRIRAAHRLRPGGVIDIQGGPGVGLRTGHVVWCVVRSVTADAVTYEAGLAWRADHSRENNGVVAVAG